MPVDRVAERKALLEIAHTDGSLNNEQKLRNEIEKFQNRFREQKPSVIDVSTDAQRLFRDDVEIVRALSTMSVDREVVRLCAAFVRIVSFLNHRIDLLEKD